MTTALAIKDWASRFSLSEFEKKIKVWNRVPIPVALGGERFRKLMRTAPGRDAFAIFVALVEVAANTRPRGLLVDERGPLSIESIAIRTGIPVAAVQRAVECLTSDEIGWLVRVEFPEVSPEADRTASGPRPLFNRPEAKQAEPCQAKPCQAKPCQASAGGEAESPSDKALPAPPKAAGSKPRGPDGLPPDATLGDVLTACGIEEPSRSKIIGAGRVTAFEVRAAWAQTVDATTREIRPVRDVIGALTAALLRRSGVAIRPSAHVGSGLADANAVLMRRRYGGEP